MTPGVLFQFSQGPVVSVNSISTMWLSPAGLCNLPESWESGFMPSLHGGRVSGERKKIINWMAQRENISRSFTKIVFPLYIF